MAQKGKDFTGGLDNLISGFVSSKPATAAQTPQAKAEGQQAKGGKPMKAAPSTATAEPQQKRGRGRPRKEATEAERRTTLILSEDMLQEIKAISYKETGRTGRKVLIKDIIGEALQQFIANYEKRQQ